MADLFPRVSPNDEAEADDYNALLTAVESTMILVSSGISGLSALPGVHPGSRAVVERVGLYRYDSTYAGPFDGETAVQSPSGGGWRLEAVNLDLIDAYQLPEWEERDEYLEQLTNLVLSVVSAHNSLAARFNAHKHAGVITAVTGGTTGSTAINDAGTEEALAVSANFDPWRAE